MQIAGNTALFRISDLFSSPLCFSNKVGEEYEMDAALWVQQMLAAPKHSFVVEPMFLNFHKEYVEISANAAILLHIVWQAGREAEQMTIATHGGAWHRQGSDAMTFVC